MNLKVIKPTESDGKWEVWMGLDGDVNPPAGISLIIGLGETRNEALANAVVELDMAVDELLCMER